VQPSSIKFTFYASSLYCITNAALSSVVPLMIQRPKSFFVVNFFSGDEVAICKQML
jgi:hypothetical protein